MKNFKNKIKASRRISTIPGIRSCMSGLLIFLCGHSMMAQEGQQWVTYEGSAGSWSRHIVFVSGDEEYRSEEALPMLAKILSVHHGFKCTVLFAIDPETGKIDPDYQTNIPGLHQLETADLMVMLLRFRELPDEQMKFIDAYTSAGKPVVALRTSTHAFRYRRDLESQYTKYSFNSITKGWEGGYGRQVLGETWVSHHGRHGKEGTRGIINGLLKNHAILRGVRDIWGATDVYTVRDLTDNAQVLVYGQPTQGMIPDAPVNHNKTAMPVAWIKYYTSEKGNTARIFNTTMGAAVDLLSEDLRRLLVNACYWAMGMDQEIPAESKVDIVGEYDPTMFGFGKYKAGLTPSDFELEK